MLTFGLNLIALKFSSKESFRKKYGKKGKHPVLPLSAQPRFFTPPRPSFPCPGPIRCGPAAQARSLSPLAWPADGRDLALLWLTVRPHAAASHSSFLSSSPTVKDWDSADGEHPRPGFHGIRFPSPYRSYMRSRLSLRDSVSSPWMPSRTLGAAKSHRRADLACRRGVHPLLRGGRQQTVCRVSQLGDGASEPLPMFSPDPSSPCDIAEHRRGFSFADPRGTSSPRSIRALKTA